MTAALDQYLHLMATADEADGVYRSRLAAPVHFGAEHVVGLSQLAMRADFPQAGMTVVIDVGGHAVGIALEAAAYTSARHICSQLTYNVRMAREQSRERLSELTDSTDLAAFLLAVQERNVSSPPAADEIPNYRRLLTFSVGEHGFTRLERQNSKLRAVWLQPPLREMLGMAADADFKAASTVDGVRPADLFPSRLLSIESAQVMPRICGDRLRPLLRAFQLSPDVDINKEFRNIEYVRPASSELSSFEFRLFLGDAPVRTHAPVALTLHVSSRIPSSPPLV